MSVRSPLIWFGGKGKTARHIIPHFPAHKLYVEPFGGAAHVITQKPRSQMEVYNDIDGELVNFLLIARDNSDKLITLCENLPYSRELFERWQRDKPAQTELQRAVQFFYLNRSGVANGNAENRTTGWRHATTVKCNPAAEYMSTCNRLRDFSERLQGVLIDRDDFRTVINKYDGPDTLFYVDPPYIGREKYYAGGFTEQEHRELAELLNKAQGRVVISYYDDPLLHELYPNWYRETFQSPRQVVNGDNDIALELLLMNFENGQLTLF